MNSQVIIKAFERSLKVTEGITVKVTEELILNSKHGEKNFILQIVETKLNESISQILRSNGFTAKFELKTGLVPSYESNNDTTWYYYQYFLDGKMVAKEAYIMPETTAGFIRTYNSLVRFHVERYPVEFSALGSGSYYSQPIKYFTNLWADKDLEISIPYFTANTLQIIEAM